MSARTVTQLLQSAPATALPGKLGSMGVARRGFELRELVVAEFAGIGVLAAEQIEARTVKMYPRTEMLDLIVIDSKRQPVGMIDLQDLPKLKLL